MPFDASDLFGWTLYDGKGILVASALLLLLLIFLTGPPRRKIRWALTYMVLHLLLLALRLLFPHDSAVRVTLKFLALFLLLSCIGLSIFLLLTQSRLSQAVLRPLPKIFIDIVHSVVYLIAFLISLSAAGVQPTELFAGSALLTAVIGLSLRDTLGNLFAGLAIQAQRPFEVGDWIQFNQDSSQAGQVAEINWRATRVVTLDRVEIIVPNALLAQAPIVNFSRPEAPIRRVIYVHVPYRVRPQRAKEIILAALEGVPAVLKTPAPSVVTTAFEERGVQLCVRIYVATFPDKGKAESGVRDRIWYALSRHGIDIPVPSRAVRVQKLGKRTMTRRKKERIAHRQRALACVDFFDHLDPATRRRLAARVRTRLYAAQEIIIRQGDVGDELFILEAGEVAVLVDQPEEEPLELDRMGPGNFFGEMAAMTGEPRRATVRALQECEVLVIGKAALAEVFTSAPEVAEQVSKMIAQREANLNARLSEKGPPPPHVVAEHCNRLLHRIKEFFSV